MEQKKLIDVIHLLETNQA